MTPAPPRNPTRRAALGVGVAAAVAAGCSQGSTPRPVSEPTPAPRPAPVRARRGLGLRASGLDPAALERADAAASALPQLRSMIIARHGTPLLERRYRGPELDTPVNIKSASKTVLALVAGAAMAAGEVPGLDTPIVPLLGGRPSGADPRVDSITLGHLLSMRAGLQSTSGRNYGPWAVSRDPVRHALTRPMEDRPGGAMIYSTGTSHLTSAVLTEASGQSTLALARRYLGEPLGIAIPAWERDPTGVYYGGNNMMMSPRDLLRIGEMCRAGGTLDGVQVVPQSWLEASWQSRGRSRWTGHGYGYGWWLTRAPLTRTPQPGAVVDVRYAWGYGGQMLFVVPSLGISVVMTSASNPSDTVRGHVWQLHTLLREHILPGALQRRESADLL